MSVIRLEDDTNVPEVSLDDKVEGDISKNVSENEIHDSAVLQDIVPIADGLVVDALESKQLASTEIVSNNDDSFVGGVVNDPVMESLTHHLNCIFNDDSRNIEGAAGVEIFDDTKWKEHLSNKQLRNRLMQELDHRRGNCALLDDSRFETIANAMKVINSDLF